MFQNTERYRKRSVYLYKYCLYNITMIDPFSFLIKILHRSGRERQLKKTQFNFSKYTFFSLHIFEFWLLSSGREFLGISFNFQNRKVEHIHPTMVLTSVWCLARIITEIIGRRNTVWALEFSHVGWAFERRCFTREKLIGRDGFGATEFLLCIIIVLRCVCGAALCFQCSRWWWRQRCFIATCCRCWEHGRYIGMSGFDWLDCFEAHGNQIRIVLRRCCVHSTVVIIEKIVIFDLLFITFRAVFWCWLLRYDRHIIDSWMSNIAKHIDG